MTMDRITPTGMKLGYTLNEISSIWVERDQSSYKLMRPIPLSTAIHSKAPKAPSALFQRIEFAQVLGAMQWAMDQVRLSASMLAMAPRNCRMDIVNAQHR